MPGPRRWSRTGIEPPATVLAAGWAGRGSEGPMPVVAARLAGTVATAAVVLTGLAVTALTFTKLTVTALTVTALTALPLWSQPARAEEPARYPVECRLEGGPWSPCVMTVEAVGERWQIDLNGVRVVFRHDGKGTVQMRKPSGPWQTVSGHWADDQALCWDGVCAKGSFPLD